MNEKLQKVTLGDNILQYHSAELQKVHFVCKKRNDGIFPFYFGLRFKLLACGTRGPGFDSPPRHLNFRDWLSPASKSRYG